MTQKRAIGDRNGMTDTRQMHTKERRRERDGPTVRDRDGGQTNTKTQTKRERERGKGRHYESIERTHHEDGHEAG